jgi:1A family penicillin-binding protein
VNCRAIIQLLLISCFLITLSAPPLGAQEPLTAHPPLPIGYKSIKVFDNQQRFAGRILPEKRYWVSIDRIPLFLQKAVVAVEDARFYEHNGIDLRGIARAVVKDVVKGRLAEGGSTITQQLVKNKYLSAEKSIDRKVNEGLMALELEKKYTKKQILEMYLNEIYYGNGAWGIAQAARIYFDKAPEALNDAECSLLAGVPKNPGRYNPLGKAVNVSQRRAIVLKRMIDLGMISSNHKKQITSQPVAPMQPNQAPYYLAHIRATLIERYGAGIIEQGGLEVTTAMNIQLQKQAEQTLREGVNKISPHLQGALVSIDPSNGNLLAAVGGTDFAKSPYNRALYAKRQPGSAFKPLIYAAALDKGINAASLWNDAPASYSRGDGTLWKPLNYDGKTHGELSLRRALATSNNVIAVKLLNTIGLPYFVDYAEDLGLTITNRNDLSLALGTEEVTLHDLAMAYTPFANGGRRPEPRSIIRLYDTYRKVWTENPAIITPVICPSVAYITTSILKDVLITGTAKGLKKFSQQHPAAGKTGTTNDYRDAWFIGYTPQMVTGVWVGYDQPKPGGRGFTGGVLAAPIWERFMRHALSGKATVDFTVPATVVSVTIDPATGNLATSDSPGKKEELFVSGTEPADYCQQELQQPLIEPEP